MKTALTYFQLIIILFVAFKFLSCKNRSPYLNVQDKTIELKGTNVGPINFFLKPQRIFIDSNYILISDFKTDSVFHIFDEKFSLKKSLISMGRGPNEINFPMLSNQQFIRNKAIICFDLYQRQINKILFNNTSNFEFNTITRIEIPFDLVEVQNIQFIGQDNFVARGCGTLGKLCFFNIESKELKFTPFYPYVNHYNESIEFFQKYNGDQAFNFHQKKLVCSNRYFNELEIYSDKGDLITEIRISKLVNPFSETDYYYQYNSITCTAKYIYASYIGENMKNLTPDKMKNKKTEIHVFDWNGKLVQILILDRFTGFFAVDENDNYMICADEINQYQPFVRYDLPHSYPNSNL